MNKLIYFRKIIIHNRNIFIHTNSRKEKTKLLTSSFKSINIITMQLYKLPSVVFNKIQQ